MKLKIVVSCILRLGNWEMVGQDELYKNQLALNSKGAFHFNELLNSSSKLTNVDSKKTSI